MDVADWLRALGLERYEATFRENDVGAELLPSLTADDLKDLGITSVGHRRQILEAIAALPVKNVPVTDPRPPISPNESPRPAETTAERRPLSVMFCDLIGSTAMSSRLDPEDLREVIRTYQACVATTIQQFGGFIARYVGDGVLIYFGWPEAGETDAERAVRAGLAVAAAVSAAPVNGTPLQVRVGIATGLVVIGEPIGTGDSRQQTAVGETPNLAARLQGLAGSNEVVIDAATRQQIGGLFACRDLGAIELKGLPAAVLAWQVLSEDRTLGQFEALRSRTTPLVGRDEEMELLLRRWAETKTGNGRAVLVSAEPGVGKSRLAEALAERIAAEPHVRMRYFCSPHHQDSALYPVIAQMERAAGFTHADAPAARLAKLQALLVATAPPTEEDVALLAELHSLKSAALAPPLDITPQRNKEKTFEALLRHIEGLSKQQPLLMVFDDLHWIDPSSRELLDRVMERVANWRVLLMVLFRPEFQPPWTGQPHVTMLTLTRLHRQDTAAMVATVAGSAALPSEIIEEIAERADGVPLFVEELTKAVLESGAQGAAALSSVPHPSVPATLHASLMARLDRLGLVAKDVAQTGAAIGREFGYEVLASATDLPEPQVCDGLDRLANAGLLFVRGTPPDSSYMFKHALVQDAAYGTLLRSRRQLLHSRIAATLQERFPEVVLAQPALLAQHYAEAGLPQDAIRYWLKAGQQALGLSGMVEAAALLRKGLSLIATVPDSLPRQEHELDLQIGLGQAIIATEGYAAPGVSQAYARARELCERLGCADKLLPILYGQWAYYSVADLIQAHKLAAEIRHFSEVQDNAVVRVMSSRASGLTSLMTGDLAVARTYLEQGLSLYDTRQQRLYASIYATTDPLIFFQSYLSLALVCCGHLHWARSRADSALEHARGLSHAHSLGFALHWTWVACRCARSEPTALLSQADELLALSNKRSFVMWRALSLAFRGWCLAALGQPDQGIPLMSAGLADVRPSGTLHVPHVLTLCADAHRMAGQPHAALAYVAEAEQFAETTQINWLQAETLRLRGDLMLVVGDSAGAEASFLGAITLAQRQGAKLFQLRASISLARLWCDQAKRVEARDLLGPIYHWFTEGFDERDLNDAKALLNELA